MSKKSIFMGEVPLPATQFFVYPPLFDEPAKPGFDIFYSEIDTYHDYL